MCTDRNSDYSYNGTHDKSCHAINCLFCRQLPSNTISLASKYFKGSEINCIAAYFRTFFLYCHPVAESRWQFCRNFYRHLFTDIRRYCPIRNFIEIRMSFVYAVVTQERRLDNFIRNNFKYKHMVFTSTYRLFRFKL